MKRRAPLGRLSWAPSSASSSMVVLCVARRSISAGSSFFSAVPARPHTTDIATLQGDNSKLTDNKEFVDAMNFTELSDEIVAFRKEDRPWQIVPCLVRKKVLDLVGILTSAHKMEMEKTIEQMREICDLDLRIVIVPTVGYTSPRVFAQSLFWNWQIGEPRGNGMLIVVSQHDAAIQIVTSPAIQEYFGKEFCDVLVKEVMGDLIRDGKSSLALVHATYHVAQFAQECSKDWNNGLVPLPTKNKIRYAERVVVFGALYTWSFYWTIIFTVMTAMFWSSIMDSWCPQCWANMHKVIDEDLIKEILTNGQRLERDNGCTKFRIQKCPDCKHEHITVLHRDMFHNYKCLKCEECEYHTLKLNVTTERLPTKHSDGLKRLIYNCENCHAGRDIPLPLFRPLDEKPQDKWYKGLLERAESPSKDRKSLI